MGERPSPQLSDSGKYSSRCGLTADIHCPTKVSKPAVRVLQIQPNFCLPAKPETARSFAQHVLRIVRIGGVFPSFKANWQICELFFSEYLMGASSLFTSFFQSNLLAAKLLDQNFFVNCEKCAKYYYWLTRIKHNAA